MRSHLEASLRHHLLCRWAWNISRLRHSRLGDKCKGIRAVVGDGTVIIDENVKRYSI